ncbi:HD-GYP domain-containing protein [Cetobacterium sp.]|uniref:HD-GYP domain-containing protein n=1 Tax=Cetobacterium sp. TaxID=2071632 RepID=UPI003F32E4DA
MIYILSILSILSITFIIFIKIQKELYLKKIIKGFELANSFNDCETGEHILRIKNYSILIAEELNCSKFFIKEIEKYSSLHDIGKIGISEVIIKKPGKLDEKEFEEVKKHVKIGWKLIKDLSVSKIAENIILYHHEKYDGSGYAFGLKKEEIPLEARIVAIADVYDALRQKRCYKESYSHEKAVEIIKNERGKHFDPMIVDIFLKNNGKFKEIFDCA